MPATSDLPAPRASRLTKPGWRDPRLLGGVLLVALAVGGTSRVVAQADDRVEVYAAARTLVAGEVVSAQDLRVVGVDIDGSDGGYARAQRELAPGTVVVRTIPAGELLPSAALGNADQLRHRAVTVPVEAAMTDVLTPGSRVDLWVSPKDTRSAGARYLPPQQLLASAEVARLPKARSGMVTSLDGVRVQILVPRDQVSAVIEHVDQGSKVSLVPTGDPVPTS